MSFAMDVGKGIVLMGIPEGYYIAKAMYEGDEEALIHHTKVAGVVHGIWYTAYQLAKMYDIYAKGGRNLISFHQAMQGKKVLAGQAVKRLAMTAALNPIAAPVTATAAAITYEKYVNEPIRESHGGASGTWFGPFASGFGSVV